MNHKILYIEDNPRHVRLIAKMLEPEGFALMDSPDGLQGIAKAAREKPDLILLDFNLPDLDGFEIISRLRSDRVLSEIPVIAVTAHSAPDALARFIEAGFDAYVPKPVSRQQLLQAVYALLKPSGQPAAVAAYSY